jgi:hypothetical protein
MAYTAYVLADESRSLILNKFQPKFSDVVAHHVTENAGVLKTEYYIPDDASVRVVGYACDDSIEALIVEVNGNPMRKDGYLFHITLSLDRSMGAKPSHSNSMILEKGFTKIDPFYIETNAQLIK